MGGKKLPKINREYEKKRRDRLNDQFTELHELLPDFNSSIIKVTKAEIIGRTIEYLKNAKTKNKKMENEFENEKSKINELQKKVARLLQVVKELIKLLHKSNISFPSSLPVEDIASFKEELLKCKRKSIMNSNDAIKKRKPSSEYSDSNSESESVDLPAETTNSRAKTSSESVSSCNALSSSSPQITTVTRSSTTATTVITQTTTTTCSSHVITNVELPQVLRLDSNPLILPQGNLVAVNGLSNTLIGNASPSSTILLNKPITVPTFILMQNTGTNLVAVAPTTAAKCVESTAQSTNEKSSTSSKQPPLLVTNATNTTFINKKPIPAVRLFKSRIEPKDGDAVSQPLPTLKRKKGCRRSKGILVKYPKRKPPLKDRKKCRETNLVANDESSGNTGCKTVDKKSEIICSSTQSTVKDDSSLRTTSNPQICGNSNGDNASQYSKTGSENVDKSYSCNSHQISVFDSANLPTSSNQFMDFFDNSSTTAARCIMNSADNTNRFTSSNEKPHTSNFNSTGTESFQRSVAVFDASKTKSKQKELEKRDKDLHCDPTPSTSNAVSILPKYVTTNETRSTVRTSIIETLEGENKQKCEHHKNDMSIPLSIHCDNHQSKPKPVSPKGHLNLSLMDDSNSIGDHLNKKTNNYETFDEFPSDLFTSLQVPAVSGHNTDSISPTAAFLQTFPLVSNCANVDLLPEHDEDNATSTNTHNATNILQIGNLEPSSSNSFFPLLTNKSNTRESLTSKSTEKNDYAVFTSSNLVDMDGLRKEKKSSCKESSGGTANYGMINFNDINLGSEPFKMADCPKEQNIPFYTTSSTASSFASSYSSLLPPVTCSYYSFGSQPFNNSMAKSTSDSTMTDYNAWMPPPVYSHESVTNREKIKKDTKNTSNLATTFVKNTASNEFSQQRTDQTKTKRPKTNSNVRPLVNWMTTPEPLRAASELVPPPPLDIPISMPKDDTMFLNSTSTFLQPQNNTNFNMPSLYPSNGCNNGSGEYFFDSQNYLDSSSNLASCKIAHSTANPSTTNRLWPSASTSSKTTLPPPSLPLDTQNMIVSTPLPTLVGDLALCGNTNSSTPFNNFDLSSKKYDATEKKKNSSSSTPCDKNYYKNTAHNSNSSSFLSVTQLVDDKSANKQNHQQPLSHQPQQLSKKNVIPVETTAGSSCNNYKDDRNARYRMNYGITGNDKDVDNGKHCKEMTSSSRTSNIKCTKKETTSKYNNVPANRYTSTTKENITGKKDFVRSSQQYHQHHHKSFTNEYSLQNCQQPQQQNEVIATTSFKEAPSNVLHNKNTNYSAESLIGSSNHQNTSCSQNYFPYENLNYSNCPSVGTNQYSKKAIDQNQLSNVGYYPNTTYVYPNNFQSFNSNYTFSNQCYNNYSSQIVQPNGDVAPQKKKFDHYVPSKESSWCKEGAASYSESMATEYGENQKLDARNKHQQSTSSSSYPNKYQHNDKTGTVVDTAAFNKYYQCSSSTSSPSSSLSLMTNQTKNSCNLNSMYSLCQSGQQFSQSHHQPSSNYDTTKSSRNTVTANSNVHVATTLTNFNLSTIFPEINDKHCGQSRVTTIGNEKPDSKYTNGKTTGLDEMNYNYLIQPSIGNNLHSNSVYG